MTNRTWFQILEDLVGSCPRVDIEKLRNDDPTEYAALVTHMAWWALAFRVLRGSQQEPEIAAQLSCIEDALLKANPLLREWLQARENSLLVSHEIEYIEQLIAAYGNLQRTGEQFLGYVHPLLADVYHRRCYAAT